MARLGFLQRDFRTGVQGLIYQQARLRHGLSLLPRRACLCKHSS
jgi:hypothetical protein